MGARAVIVDALDAALPATVDVLPYEITLAVVDAPTVMVRVDTIRPAPRAGALSWEVDATLLLVGTQTSDPAAVEDELDSLLAQVCVALQGIPALRWTEAKATAWPEATPTNPAYAMAVILQTQEVS